jgi:D-alanine-D-alanine ligase-like ATP-grasp enzyme
MLHVSSSLPDIAVLRGGSLNFKQSLAEGVDTLSSLNKIGYKPLDVVIGKDGQWTTGGVPTDAHHIFTRTHTVVDVTHMKGEKYQKLAQEMAIPMIFSRNDEMITNREDMYRILRMQGIPVPETKVIRSSAPIKDSALHTLWTTFHTPLMVRPLERRQDIPSKLVTAFGEFDSLVRDYHEKGIDVHVLTYKKTPTLSLSVLPNFRGEKLYTPLWVETFNAVKGLPDLSYPMRPHAHAPEAKKKEIKDFVSKAYSATGATIPLSIDIVPTQDGYMVVNVESSPSLHKDGRFMQSLATTGIDIGEYIHSRIQEELEHELSR